MEGIGAEEHDPGDDAAVWLFVLQQLRLTVAGATRLARRVLGVI
jgi:hypothetical protein